MVESMNERLGCRSRKMSFLEDTGKETIDGLADNIWGETERQA